MTSPQWGPVVTAGALKAPSHWAFLLAVAACETRRFGVAMSVPSLRYLFIVPKAFELTKSLEAGIGCIDGAMARFPVEIGAAAGA